LASSSVLALRHLTTLRLQTLQSHTMFAFARLKFARSCSQLPFRFLFCQIKIAQTFVLTWTQARRQVKGLVGQNAFLGS